MRLRRNKMIKIQQLFTFYNLYNYKIWIQPNNYTPTFNFFHINTFLKIYFLILFFQISNRNNLKIVISRNILNNQIISVIILYFNIMYSYLFGSYFYQKDIIEMIDKIETKRKMERLAGNVMKTSFAEDLKNLMMGIEDTIIKDIN